MIKKNRDQVSMLLYIILILAIINITINLALYARMGQLLDKPREHNSTSASLTVPTHLLYEEYDCVNQLIEGMNISNVHIIPPNESQS